MVTWSPRPGTTPAACATRFRRLWVSAGESFLLTATATCSCFIAPGGIFVVVVVWLTSYLSMVLLLAEAPEPEAVVVTVPPGMLAEVPAPLGLAAPPGAALWVVVSVCWGTAWP